MCSTIKTFIINASDWYNKGDVGNRIGMILALKKAFGDNVNIVLESSTAEIDSKYFAKYGVKVIQGPLHIQSSRHLSISLVVHMFLKYLYLALLAFTARVFKIPKVKDPYLNEMLCADLILSSAGGFIHDELKLVSLQNIIPIAVASLILNKPVILYAQSIGPFSRRFTILLTKVVLSRIELIILRERKSIEYIEKMGLKVPVLVTTDASFTLLSLLNGVQKNVSRPIRKVGVTVVGKFESRNFERDYVKYVTTLASVIRYIIEKYQAKVYILPQTLIEYDVATAYLLKNLVTRANQMEIEIVKMDCTPEKLISMYAKMDFMICSRLHSAIFASLSGTPIIVLSYQHKAEGILEQLGLKELVVDIRKISLDKLIPLVDYVAEHKESLHNLMEKRILVLYKKSLVSAFIVKHYLNKLKQ